MHVIGTSLCSAWLRGTPGGMTHELTSLSSGVLTDSTVLAFKSSMGLPTSESSSFCFFSCLQCLLRPADQQLPLVMHLAARTKLSHRCRRVLGVFFLRLELVSLATSLAACSCKFQA